MTNTPALPPLPEPCDDGPCEGCRSDNLSNCRHLSLMDYDFGIRRIPPCKDCWDDGHCSMNCAPRKENKPCGMSSPSSGESQSVQSDCGSPSSRARLTTNSRRSICPVCGYETSFEHDHKPDNSGLDDGPEINPGRKKAARKSPEVTAEIRARAWATRRAKYGAHGHG